MTSLLARIGLGRPELRAWAMYDWANSAFWTTVIVAVFPPFFSEYASAGLPAGRIAIGEQLANAKGKATGQSCIDCHGPDGNAPIDATYPKLGGQYADYLAHALQEYRTGDRQHALMTPQAADLSDQDIADLGAFFGSRTSQLRDLHGAH